MTTFSFRANTLKITPEQLQQKLEQVGLTPKPVAWLAAAYTLPQSMRPQLLETQEFAEGLLYIQNLSSMIPVVVLDPQPGETVLDMAAAPGSKTTQLAVQMKNTGKLVANDVSRARVFKLRANCAQQGVTCAEFTQQPGEKLWHHYPEYFDRVLLDAPCSMEGRANHSKLDTVDRSSPAKVRQLAQKQKLLLRSAFSATKPGGLLVYSTCTLNPAENEAVVQWLLNKEGDAVKIQPITLPAKAPGQSGLLVWEEADFDPSMSNTVRIEPNNQLEGFFIALLKKTRSSIALL